MFYQQPAGQPFSFLLPRLERVPASVPVAITLDPTSSQPSWLEFDPKALQISGVTPMAGDDQVYHLIVEARVEDGHASRLNVYTTIIGGPEPIISASPQVATPTRSNRPSAKDCLWQILKGNPCAEY